MRKIFILLIIVMFTISINFATEVNVSLQINEQYIKTTENNLLIDGRTYIIAKDIINALEGDIEWNGEERKVTMCKNNIKLEFFVDSTNVLVSNEEVKLDAVPFIREGRTYIPIRYVAEFFGYEISWNQETYTASIYDKELKVDEKFIDLNHYTYNDLNWLAKIVQVESSDGSMEMKLAIANVVLNRVKDSRFPDTVKEVIFDTASTVQFPPAHKESFNKVIPSTKTIIASKNALEGINNIENCLYFNNRPFNWKKDDLHQIIDGEYFYK